MDVAPRLFGTQEYWILIICLSPENQFCTVCDCFDNAFGLIQKYSLAFLHKPRF